MIEVFDPTQLQLQVMAGRFRLIHKGSRHHQGHPIQLLRGADVTVFSGSVSEAKKYPRWSLVQSPPLAVSASLSRRC